MALQYGHRQSIDLDFFGDFRCEQEETQEILSKYGKVEVLKETQRIRIYSVDGIKVDFVYYLCYPWLAEVVLEDGIRLASTKDIAAIEGRGTRKDFVDIYFLLQHYSLKEILEFYKAKYPNYSDFRALMSLTYFEDAEAQPMPIMFDSTTWSDMQNVIISKVRQLQ